LVENIRVLVKLRNSELIEFFNAKVLAANGKISS